MKKILLGLISVVFLMGAGLITWNLTRVVNETIQIGGSTQDVLNIERTFKEDAILTEGETLTFRYDVKKLDKSNDYYLSVSLTGASVDAVTITSITPENLQLTDEMQEVEIVIGLLETATPGEFTVQFLFEAIEGFAAESNVEFIETFTKVPTDNSTSYITRDWTGVEGVEFIAKQSRTSLGGYTIENGGLMFDGSDPKLTATIDNGISSFSVDILMGFTGGTPEDRTITVYINNIKVGSHTLETDTVENLTIEHINVSGTFDLKITFESRQITINNLKWTTYTD